MNGEATIRIRAMGTVAEVVAFAGDADADELVASASLLLWDLERRWSRFDPASEVSACNAAAGSAVAVGTATITLFEIALAGYVATAGAFDPTVLGDLERAGYDRSFAEITPVSATAARSARRRGACGIAVDRERSTVRIPDGVGFDPGGIGKGLAADLVVDAMCAAGAEGACVNIGGDARVAGTAADGRAWPFRIEDPSGGVLASVRIANGAIATSATAIRSWRRGAKRCHHLVDPDTGRPVDTDIASVTVVAARAWQAEVLTKAVFVAGLAAGVALVDRLGAAVLVVARDGVTTASPGWERFVVPADRAPARPGSGSADGRTFVDVLQQNREGRA